MAEKDTSLSGIIEDSGHVYERGRAYYEFVRDHETISEGKKIVLMEKVSKPHAESHKIEHKHAMFTKTNYLQQEHTVQWEILATF